jgi:O-antigen/teichoic acid export membrane protein/GT2 family glycosyltransferase
MKVGFITVVFNTPQKEIIRLKQEIMCLGFADYQIYIIDNTKNNLGYAAGVNQGIKKALADKADLLVIFNPDISFYQVTCEAILAGIKKFALLGFGFWQNGKIYYGGKIDYWRMSGGLIDQKPTKRYISVDYISGSLIILKRDVIKKLGLFPEDYFLYYEDVDYCYKARHSGFDCGIDSEVLYKHYEQSDFNNLAKKDLLFKNRLRFFLKYASLPKKIRELGRLPKTLWEERNFFWRFFINSSFLTNYFGMNLTSFLTKLFNFVWFLVMLKYLTPQEYGIYTLVWSQVNLLAPLVDLGTTSYGIIYSEKEKNLKQIISLRYLLGSLVFCLTLMGGWLFNRQLFLFIAAAAATVFSNMTSGGYLIIKALQEKAYFSSLFSFGFNALLILSLILGLTTTNSFLLIFVIIAVNYLFQALIYFRLINKELGEFSFHFQWQKWKKIITRSYQFVLINLLSQIYFKIDVFLLSALKNNTEVGIYSAGFKFFQTLMFFASSYTLASSAKLVRLANQNYDLMLKKMKKDLLFLSFFGFSLALGFYFFAPLILSVILKKVYGASLVVAQITVFALPFILLNSVFFNILYILKKTYVVIYLFIFQLFFNFIFNRLLIPQFSFYASAYISVVSEVVNLLLLIFIFRFILKQLKYEKK